MEENSYDFCLEFVQEFGLLSGPVIGVKLHEDRMAEELWWYYLLLFFLGLGFFQRVFKPFFTYWAKILQWSFILVTTSICTLHNCTLSCSWAGTSAVDFFITYGYFLEFNKCHVWWDDYESPHVPPPFAFSGIKRPFDDVSLGRCVPVRSIPPWGGGAWPYVGLGSKAGVTPGGPQGTQGNKSISAISCCDYPPPVLEF